MSTNPRFVTRPPKADKRRARREYDRERKARNLESADPTGWTIHTEHHWSRTINGKRLDYWPSRNKFQYEGRVMTGDVLGLIRKREDKNGAF